MSAIPDWFVAWFNTALGGGLSGPNAPQPADAGISLVANKISAAPGETIVFTVMATNSGPGTATGLVVSVPLSNAFTMTSVTPGQGSYDPTTGIWTVGDVAATASATLLISATAVGQGWSVLTAAITAQTSADPNPANSAATVGVALPPPGASNAPVHSVASVDGTGVAPAMAGAFNIEVVSGPVAGNLVTLEQGYQAVYLSGRTAAALVDASFGGAILAGNAGDDTIMSAAQNDTLQAGAGNNLIVAFSGSSLMTANGQVGNNTFFGGSGVVTVQGGGGRDTAVLGLGGGVVNTGTAGSQVWMGAGNTLINSYGADTIVGGSGAETVNVLSSLRGARLHRQWHDGVERRRRRQHRAGADRQRDGERRRRRWHVHRRHGRRQRAQQRQR